MDFAIGALAASGACLFSNPFDVLKTRMQLQGELKARGQHAVHYRNVFHAGVVVVKNEGLRGLQRGLGTALLMHSVRNSIRLGSYQVIYKNGYLTDSNGKTIMYRSALCSAFAGAAGAFFGSPLFLVKTQLQSQAAKNIAVGFQHGHQGPFTAFMEIYGTFGIVGLWRGFSGTVVRAIVGSSAQLTTFALTKDVLSDTEFFKERALWGTFLASLISGVIQTVMINPFDLVSTRIYNQGIDKRGKGLLYTSLLDCFIKTARSEGFIGFYKGIGANYMRLAPHGALCLLFWDYLKELQERYI